MALRAPCDVPRLTQFIQTLIDPIDRNTIYSGDDVQRFVGETLNKLVPDLNEQLETPRVRRRVCTAAAAAGSPRAVGGETPVCHRWAAVGQRNLQPIGGLAGYVREDDRAVAQPADVGEVQPER